MTTEEFVENNIAVLPREDSFNLRVSVIYENETSGHRAKECLDHLARNLDAGADVFDVHFLSYDLLTDPAMRQSSAREAEDYEIILLATRDPGEPPVAVKDWLREWLSHRGTRPCALAVLSDKKDPAAAEDAPLHHYLTGVAEAGGLDLVVYPQLKPMEPPVVHHSLRQITRRAINASPLLEGILDDWESYSHWGINE